MAKYKMLKTHPAVKAGEVHPSVFHEGKTYDIDDDLAAQFDALEIVEESDSDEVSVAVNEEGREDLHENWLDVDPAVLRHGELTAGEVVAKDESPLSEDAIPADQERGKAEGEPDADEEADGKAASKSKKSK